MKAEKNVIVELSISFALEIIKYSERLLMQNKYVLAKQMLRSGTSIGASVHESQHAESMADFIHKLKIASKEAMETRYWLFLCNHAENYPRQPELMSNLEVIQKILSKIIDTSKKKLMKSSKIPSQGLNFH